VAQVSSAWRTEAYGQASDTRNAVWHPLSWLARELNQPDLVETILAPQLTALFTTLVGAANLGRTTCPFVYLMHTFASHVKLHCQCIHSFAHMET
jgi:hypothetical protein